MLLVRLMLLTLISISQLFCASLSDNLDSQIRSNYRAWSSKQGTDPKDVLSYVENLKNQRGKDNWIASILANGTGFGGLRSTTATPDEQKRMFAILKGLNPTERFIDRAKARDNLEKSHQDFIDILIKADHLKQSPEREVSPRTDYAVSRENALAKVREFWTWGGENGINHIKASMRIDSMFDDSPLRKVLIGKKRGLIARTEDIGEVTYTPQGYPEAISGSATPHLHEYHGHLGGHIAIRLDNNKENKGNTSFIVIEHPYPDHDHDDPVRYRPHFWVHEGLDFSGDHNIAATIKVDGPIQLNIEGQNPYRVNVNTHDNRLSPPEMTINTQGFTFGGDHSIAFSTYAQLDDSRVNNTLHIALGGDEDITTKSWVGQRAYAALETTLARLDVPSQQYVGRYLGYIN